jgi:putative transposase
MAHTYTINLQHIVFSTKCRHDLIDPEWEPELHAYFIGIARDKGFRIDCSGGTENHVHILANLPATLDISKALQDLKGNSSHWAGKRGFDFGWQRGYASFSVSVSSIDRVRSYIANQKQHHAKITFEDELRELLRRHGIQYDEKYLLD